MYAPVVRDPEAAHVSKRLVSEAGVENSVHPFRQRSYQRTSQLRLIAVAIQRTPEPIGALEGQGMLPYPRVGSYGTVRAELQLDT